MASARLVGSQVLHNLTRIPKTYPLAFGVILSGFKTSASDLLVQKVVEKKREIDWKRNAAFAAFGFGYLGVVQYSIYVSFFGRLFPGASAFAAKSLRQKFKDVKGMAALGAQVFMDQCIHHPFMYFPAFYCTREFVMSDKPDFGKVLSEYKANMSDDLSALWKVWVPATMLNFAFMPMYARIPFVACVSLVWTCILSAMRGGDVMHGEDIAGGAVTGATMSIMQEGFHDVFTGPVELDRDLHHVCISASGPDRVGLVALLARRIAEKGGNVTHSSMVRLGQEFVMMMHVSVPPQQRKSLIRDVMKDKDLKPLDIRATNLNRRMTGTYDAAVMGIRIKCVGTDKPGVLASVAERLADKGLSVESLSTDLQMTNKTKTREFVVEAECTTSRIHDSENLHSLMADLSTLKEELGLTVMDIRVHTA